MIATPVSPTVTTDLAVSTRGLVRKYGNSRALNRLNLAVPWDQRLAIVGANGAGKSTFLRILATLIRPTSGEVLVGGLALPDQAAAVRRHVGLVAHHTLLYDELTARENLIFYGRLYGLDRPAERADALLARVGMAERADERIRALSRGLQQRVALARAVLHDPPVLLLDEPDTGLDVRGDAILRAVMTDDAGRPRTTLLTTHNLERALELSQRVVVFAAGHVVFDALSATTTSGEVAASVRDGARAER